ncbi:MAG: hypothetical protein IJO32_05975 [Bacilli bacterium]|nr:hypothetical protein [Bacilli bacterium]
MKKIKTFNKILIIMIIIISLFLSFKELFNFQIVNFFKKLSIIPIIFIPIFSRKIFKKGMYYIIESIYIIFMFLAFYLGYILNIYNIIDGYDKFIHTLFGLVTSLYALKILKLNKVNKLKFNIIFIISFTMFSSSMWEFSEFFHDKIFGNDNQGVALTGVNDTMLDMLVSFIGTIMFNIIYYIEEKYNKNFLIKQYLKLVRDVVNKV